MNVRDLMRDDSGDQAGVFGALGATAGVVLGVLLGSGDSPLLWASVGGVAGLLVGLLVAELR